MARVADLRPTKGIRIGMQKEAETGTALTDAMGEFHITSYNLPSESVPVETGSDLVGKTTQQNLINRKDNATWTLDMTVMGTTSFYSFLSGLGFGTITDTTIYGGSESCTILIEGGGHSVGSPNALFRGCVVQSITIKQDAGTESGQTLIDVSFMTGYRGGSISGSLHDFTYPETTFADNLFSETVKIGETDLSPLSWDLTISRTMERVGYDASFNPNGYAQASVFEITGTINAKTDSNVALLSDYLKGDTSESVSFTGTGNIITMAKTKADNATYDTGGSYITTAIPFRAWGSGTVLEIIGPTSATEEG